MDDVIVDRVPRDHSHGLGVFESTVRCLELGRAAVERRDLGDVAPEPLLREWVFEVPTPNTRFDMAHGNPQPGRRLGAGER